MPGPCMFEVWTVPGPCMFEVWTMPGLCCSKAGCLSVVLIS